MDKKEKWANEVLQSLDGMQKAEPKADVFTKIITQINANEAVKIIPLKRLGWIAVAACLIIGLNLYVFKSRLQMVKNDLSKTSQKYEFITDYSLYN